MDQLPIFLSAVEAAHRIGQNERTIRRWIETGKLPATKYGSQFKIALADLEPFLDKRPPDTKALLARIIALEDIEDVQASQANRLTDLERQVFLLQAKRISELEARIAELERSRRRRRKPTENSIGEHHPDEPISS
jgi:excisionase family DNA binding protein